MRRAEEFVDVISPAVRMRAYWPRTTRLRRHSWATRIADFDYQTATTLIPAPGHLEAKGGNGPQTAPTSGEDKSRPSLVGSVLHYVALVLRVTILLFFGSSPSSAVTFDDLRADLLGNEVVVLGADWQIDGCVKDWVFADGDVSTGFKLRTTDGLSLRARCVPKSFIGRRGKVVSVELDQKLLFKQTDERSAFGDHVTKSRVPNQFTIVVVRMIEDGTQIGIKSFPNTIWQDNLRLVRDFQASNTEIDQNLKHLVGKELVHNAYTELLATWATVADLLDRVKRDSLRDRNTQNLTMLRVIDTKHLAVENAVLIKVQLPDGDERLLFGSLEHYNLKRAYVPTILERMDVSAAEEIPRRFSKREIAAIKMGTIFRGMSEDALYWSIGYPKNYNDWGRGGMQFIYGNGRFVYVKNGFVADWQSLTL